MGSVSFAAVQASPRAVSEVAAPAGPRCSPGTRGQVVTVDLGVVYVELGENELVHGPAEVAARLPVAGLGVSEQVKRQHEEVSTGGKAAAGVQQLAVDLGPFRLELGKLGLELGGGPVRVIQQFKVTVFLAIEPLQAVRQLVASESCLQFGFDEAVLAEARRLTLSTFST